MKKINLKEFKIKTKRILYKLKQKFWIVPVALITTSSFSRCFASSISTAEVSQATENVKNAIIKLAMPIRWNFSIYKYCYYFIKNDCKCK